jgi:hypothetical protein
MQIWIIYGRVLKGMAQICNIPHHGNGTINREEEKSGGYR